MICIIPCLILARLGWAPQSNQFCIDTLIGVNICDHGGIYKTHGPRHPRFETQLFRDDRQVDRRRAHESERHESWSARQCSTLSSSRSRVACPHAAYWLTTLVGLSRTSTDGMRVGRPGATCSRTRMNPRCCWSVLRLMPSTKTCVHFRCLPY